MIYTYETAPADVQTDIDYIYSIVVKNAGKRSKNYLPDQGT